MLSRTFATLATALLLSACASDPKDGIPDPTAPTQLDSRYYGTWENPYFYNWWEISRGKVISYGVDPDTRQCTMDAAQVLGTHTLRVPFGKSGTAQLRVENGKLIFRDAEDPSREAVHVPIGPSGICRDGNRYFPGAPYSP